MDYEKIAASLDEPLGFPCSIERAEKIVAVLRQHFEPTGDVGELVGRLRASYSGAEPGLPVLMRSAEQAAARITALSEQLAVAQDYKDCGCSYDNPDDICLGHLKLFERRNAALSAEVERLKAATQKRAYHVTEPYLSGHRVCIGFEKWDDAFEMHSALAALGAKP
jgi:hypothetical protein